MSNIQERSFSCAEGEIIVGGKILVGANGNNSYLHNIRELICYNGSNNTRNELFAPPGLQISGLESVKLPDFNSGYRQIDYFQQSDTNGNLLGTAQLDFVDQDGDKSHTLGRITSGNPVNNQVQCTLVNNQVICSPIGSSTLTTASSWNFKTLSCPVGKSLNKIRTRYIDDLIDVGSNRIVEFLINPETDCSDIPHGQISNEPQLLDQPSPIIPDDIDPEIVDERGVVTPIVNDNGPTSSTFILWSILIVILIVFSLVIYFNFY